VALILILKFRGWSRDFPYTGRVCNNPFLGEKSVPSSPTINLANAAFFSLFYRVLLKVVKKIGKALNFHEDAFGNFF
jgi:hypothetical protein